MVLTLVERGGIARSFHIESKTVAQVLPIVRANVAKETKFMTDEASHYNRVGTEFAFHGRVQHKDEEYMRTEYVGGERVRVGTNTVEGFYSIFKRGMKGVYQHCAEHHLHRYLAEFDFRYSNRVALGVGDVERSGKALAGIVGKRLLYRDSSAANA